MRARCQSLWTCSNWDPHKGTLAASEEILEHVEVYRAEVVEYENTDRCWIHKYGRRIRGSECLSLSGSLISTHTMLHKHTIMDIIQLERSGINNKIQLFKVSPIWCGKINWRAFNMLHTVKWHLSPWLPEEDNISLCVRALNSECNIQWLSVMIYSNVTIKLELMSLGVRYHHGRET